MNPMWRKRMRGRSRSGIRATSASAMRILPEVARRMQPMIDTNVVLPLPDEPISRRTSPKLASPYAFEISRTAMATLIP